MTISASVSSVAEAYLELLAARGIEYFFGNGGTDFAPIIEAYAKRMSQEQPLPRPITVPHEVTAVGMAHGYTMVTGRPQVVMVHTVPGTANAIGGVVNAFRSNIPMLFSAEGHRLQKGTLWGLGTAVFIGPRNPLIRRRWFGSGLNGTMNSAMAQTWKGWWIERWLSRSRSPPARCI